MSEGRGITLAIFGIVALIAIVGLVLLFSGRLTGNVAYGSTDPGIYGGDKLYGGGQYGVELPYTVNRPVKGVYQTWEGNEVAITGTKRTTTRIPSKWTTCEDGHRVDVTQLGSMMERGSSCVFNVDLNSWCCSDIDYI